jgi:hypothetical protein
LSSGSRSQQTMDAIYVDGGDVIAEVLYGPERGRLVTVSRNQRYHTLFGREYRLNLVSGLYYLTEMQNEQTNDSYS